jgi:hypothetical protein
MCPRNWRRVWASDGRRRSDGSCDRPGFRRRSCSISRWRCSTSPVVNSRRRPYSAKLWVWGRRGGGTLGPRNVARPSAGRPRHAGANTVMPIAMRAVTARSECANHRVQSHQTAFDLDASLRIMMRWPSRIEPQVTRWPRLSRYRCEAGTGYADAGHVMPSRSRMKARSSARQL